MATINIKKDVDRTRLLIVTPLLPGHKVSKETKVTVKRNKVPYIWLESIGNNNIPVNTQNGIDWYKENRGELPEYFIMIDNDIILGRGMLDKLIKKLRSQKHCPRSLRT